MPAKLPVWGIDVGQCSLKAIKLQQAGEQVEMLAFDVVEHETVLSQAAANSAEMIKKAIETFLSRNSLRDSQVVVAVPGQQTLTRFTKMPPVEPKRIPDMVQYEASQQIPFDMDEVVWDYQVFTEKDSPDVEVGIFAIRKELIRNYLLQFTEAGISPFIVQSSPMASYNAARFEQPAEPGKACVLLDMGALATDLIVMEGRRIWSRPIPIGGNRFTESLVSAFKISFGKAERLKKTAAASKHARQIFQAMRPVLQDLVNEIQRSIGYYTSTHRDAHIVRAIGMGNAFKLPGLQKFLQQNLQIEVDKLSTFKKMIIPPDKAPALGENILSFAVAYGLALQGLGQAAVASNLIPLETRRALLWTKKKPWFAASAAAMALAAAALWVGNVLASGQAKSALGDLTDLEPQAVGSVQEAERVIGTGGAGEPPLQRAAMIAGAAERLKQEYTKVAAQPAGDMSSLTAMAKLLENNVYVPRILATVYKVFEQAAPAELRAIDDPRAYAAAAKRVSRTDRQEIWLQQFDMRFDPVNAANLLPASADTGSRARDGGGESRTGRGGPGWVLTIVGETTMPPTEAPRWVDEKIIKELTKLGRQPGRGFHFERVELAKVEEAGKGEMLIPEAGSGGRDAGRGGAAAQPGTSTRGRGGRMAAGAGGGAQPRTPPTEGIRGFDARGATRRTDVKAEDTTLVEEIKKQAAENDPLLTSEPTSTDRRFLLYVVVRKEDTPKNLIPDEYKEAGSDKAGEGKPQAPEPPEVQRRDD